MKISKDGMDIVNEQLGVFASKESLFLVNANGKMYLEGKVITKPGAVAGFISVPIPGSTWKALKPHTTK